jgi:uncharacterized protein with von Willebrand factor type A (vWA) domain
LEHSDDMIHKIIQFNRTLRDYGAGGTTIQVLTAANGLKLIDIQQRQDLKALLKTALIASPEHLSLFDALFEEYFSAGFTKTPPASSSAPPLEHYDPSAPSQAQAPGDDDGQRRAKPLPVGAAREAYLARKDFMHLTDEEAAEVHRRLYRLARVLASRLRHRYGASGHANIDFRRTMRASLSTGGELIELKHKRPRPRRPRLMVLGDVSGSMAVYTRFFLVFMYGLISALPLSEAFVFSTRARRITPALKRTPPDRLLKRLVPMLPVSGGTNIGQSLTDFQQSPQAAALGPNTVIVIISDGWDRGDPADLRRVMERLQRSSRAVIWLNPLAADPTYQPLASGMKTALPHLSALMPFARLDDIQVLTRFFANGARPSWLDH